MVNIPTVDKPTAIDSGGPAAPFTADVFNPAAWMGQQARMAEAFAAAGQTYLEGLQEVATQSMMLQSALMQETIKNALSLTQAAGTGQSPDERFRAAASVMDSTVESIRNVMTAACKCHTATLGAFHERLTADGHANAAACGRPRRPR